jgi:hypothetical protein
LLPFEPTGAMCIGKLLPNTMLNQAGLQDIFCCYVIGYKSKPPRRILP